jgi:hypothetical protein
MMMKPNKTSCDRKMMSRMFHGKKKNELLMLLIGCILTIVLLTVTILYYSSSSPSHHGDNHTSNSNDDDDHHTIIPPVVDYGFPLSTLDPVNDLGLPEHTRAADVSPDWLYMDESFKSEGDDRNAIPTNVRYIVQTIWHIFYMMQYKYLTPFLLFSRRGTKI